jgi:hypothetical protein
MKNVTAIISIATVAVLLLLAVAASFIDSLPFALIASYIIGFSASIGFLALFIADYGERGPRPIPVVIKEDEPQRQLEEKAADSREWIGSQGSTPFNDPITVNLMSTLGMRDNSATSTLQ